MNQKKRTKAKAEIVTENHKQKQKQKKKRKRERMQTKLVLLGTGTPNACPNANGPSSAVVVGDRAYLVDFGPGVARWADDIVSSSK